MSLTRRSIWTGLLWIWLCESLPGLVGDLIPQCHLYAPGLFSPLACMVCRAVRLAFSSWDRQLVSYVWVWQPRGPCATVIAGMVRVDRQFERNRRSHFRAWKPRCLMKSVWTRSVPGALPFFRWMIEPMSCSSVTGPERPDEAGCDAMASLIPLLTS